MPYVFKTIKGHQERIEGPAYTHLGTYVHKSLPGGFGNLEWEYVIWKRNYLSALKQIMHGKCAEVVSQLSVRVAAPFGIGGRPREAEHLPDVYGVDLRPRQQEVQGLQGDSGESGAH